MEENKKRELRKLMMGHGLYKKLSGHTACLCGAEVVWVPEDDEWECPIFLDNIEKWFRED